MTYPAVRKNIPPAGLAAQGEVRDKAAVRYRGAAVERERTCAPPRAGLGCRRSRTPCNCAAGNIAPRKSPAGRGLLP